MAFRKYSVVLVCLLGVTFGLVRAAPLRAKYNFNPGWKVIAGDPQGADASGFDDAAWKEVTTPYAWNEDDAFRKDIKDLSTGIAWYRKRFTLPSGSDGQKVFLDRKSVV